MELQSARWRSENLAPADLDPVAAAPAKQTAQVFCRCGARYGSQQGGKVPAWFGEKCIENHCPLKERVA